MKKHFILILIAVLFIQISSFSQTDRKWETYRIGLITPVDFNIIKNDKEEFSAKSNEVFISLIPWNDSDVSNENIAKTLVQITKEMKYDEITETAELIIKDFTGYGVNGKKDGKNAVIATLVNKKTGKNLIVIITYSNGKEKIAEDILMSIYGY